MLSAHDHTAADTLHNFHNALQRAQQALTQEEARLTQLTQAVHSQNESNHAKREEIRRQQQQPLEALRHEILRVRSLVERQKEEVEAQKRHVAMVRRPRQEAESQSREKKELLLQRQRKFVTHASGVYSRWMQWWQPHNSLENLEILSKRREEEVAVLQRDVHALQQQLDVLTGKSAKPGEEEVVEREREKESTTKEVANRIDIEKKEEKEKNELASDDVVDVSPESLEIQLAQQQNQREAFVHLSTETLAERRGALERLKADLKRLCAEVEAADASQQSAQQDFHTALNQQSCVGLGCRHCGKEILGSFVL